MGKGVSKIAVLVVVLVVLAFGVLLGLYITSLNLPQEGKSWHTVEILEGYGETWGDISDKFEIKGEKIRISYNVGGITGTGDYVVMVVWLYTWDTIEKVEEIEVWSTNPTGSVIYGNLAMGNYYLYVASFGVYGQWRVVVEDYY